MLVGRSTGGIGTHAVQLARGLRDLGDEVSFVTDPLTAQRFGLGDALPWWPGRALGVIGSLRHLWRLRGLVRRADVLHAHGHQAGLLGAVVALGTRTPLVVSQHNAVLGRTGPAGAVSSLVQRFVSRRAALVSGASSDLVAEARRHGARAARLAEVPSPRVPDLLAQPPPTEQERRALAVELLRRNDIQATVETPMVLTIARVAPQKDLDTFVDAVAALPLPVTGVVVGDGDTGLLATLRTRVLAERLPVHFVGRQDDPGQWLRAADVFVLLSTWEARALVVQEAMAAGVPVVATDTGGLPDLVDGIGTLVPVRAAAAAADAVAAYLTDPAARHTASVAGRERATSWDDDDATARRWHEWYATLPRMT